MTALDLPLHTQTEAFWLGWLTSAAADAQRLLTEGDEAGYPKHDPHHAISLLSEALRAFGESPVATSLTLDTATERIYDGWVVESADGEAQAVRDTFAEADLALDDVEVYWDGALACGHPAAAGYVSDLHPFRIRQITRAERDELRQYPPTIDREP